MRITNLQKSYHSLHLTDSTEISKLTSTQRSLTKMCPREFKIDHIKIKLKIHGASWLMICKGSNSI